MGYYDKISKGYDELYGEEQIKKAKVIVKLLNINENDKILDVGCGSAIYSGLFNNYVGIDNSSGMINIAKTNVIKADAEKIPFKDNSFDVVISITSIHNFNDIEESLKEMKRVGRGKIAISVLRKSKKFRDIKNKITKYFKVQEFEEEKDIIFYSSSSFYNNNLVKHIE